MCLWLGASGLSSLSHAQAYLPVEDKIKYEAALERKAQEVIVNILGPGRARVLVEAAVEKPREPQPVAAPKQTVQWVDTSQSPPPGAQQILPGFYTAPQETERPKPQSPTVFLPFLVKKISVNVVLDKDVSSAQAANIAVVLSGMLNLDQSRGDGVNVVRAPFMPVWSAMLTDPGIINMLARYGLISVIVIISMIILAAAVIRLAGAVSLMAGPQQAHKIEMDFSGRTSSVPEAAGGAELPGGPAGEAGPEAAAGAGGGAVFDVKVGQVPLLKYMLEREEPANIAVIVSRLPPDARKALMGAFDRKLASRIMLNMATVRFVEPEIVAEIKEELERKLNGAVGGMPRVIEFMGEMGLKAKKDMIKIFEAEEPALAAELRSRVLLDDDVAALSDKDLSMLLSALTPADWSDAMPALRDDFKARIKTGMPERSWQIIEQNARFNAPSAERAEAGLEKLVASAERLIKEGKITRPAAAPRLAAPGGKSDAG